ALLRSAVVLLAAQVDIIIVRPADGSSPRRAWRGRRSGSQEQVAEDLHGIGQLELVVSIGIGGVQARWSIRAKVQGPQDADCIRQLEVSARVRIAAVKPWLDGARFRHERDLDALRAAGNLEPVLIDEADSKVVLSAAFEDLDQEDVLPLGETYISELRECQ